MANIMIAPVGDNLDALYVGVREFPIEQVVLVTPINRLDKAEKAKKDLERFKIPASIIKIEGELMENMFRIFGEIKSRSKNKNILVNVATGDKMSTCIALSAAFVNGMKAFSVERNKPFLLPVMRFSYYKLLTDKKLQILKILYNEKSCCASLEELSKKSNMSLPLISYHINGNQKSEGLKEMGLVETKERRGRIEIHLSSLGNLLIQGYIS